MFPTRGWPTRAASRRSASTPRKVSRSYRSSSIVAGRRQSSSIARWVICSDISQPDRRSPNANDRWLPVSLVERTSTRQSAVVAERPTPPALSPVVVFVMGEQPRSHLFETADPAGRARSIPDLERAVGACRRPLSRDPKPRRGRERNRIGRADLDLLRARRDQGRERDPGLLRAPPGAFTGDL